ncbi:hypothetical protein [Aestuariivita sp.]|uniref:hypothetical protein n=1 Tax=Aestuariivita sp. TaxID=1872407 RepID=UPI00216C9BA0|nr:hypothetical protein [Aestuariivita sp.]MCE8006285.1 hypothetical protein [Aestuariivita sp.]
MSLTWIFTYVLVFVGGPLIVLGLLRGAATVGAVRKLGLVTLVLVFTAIAATMLGAPGLLAAGLLWGSWVISMALVGQVLRLMVESQGARRWTAALAAVGATVPWFGILVARAMAG